MESLASGRSCLKGAVFPTKLSTDFVDKNFALLLQQLSFHFNTSHEDAKPS